MGLDYTKAVVISDSGMVSSDRPRVAQEEFDALKGKDALITSGMRKYYKLVLNATRFPGNTRYNNILRCSALKYFL